MTTTTRKNKAEIYKDRKGEFRWRLLAFNGKIIDAATEGFKTRASCVGNLKKIAQAFTNFEVVDHQPKAAKKKATKRKATSKTKAKKAAKPKAKKKTAKKPGLRAIPGGKKNGGTAAA